MALSQKLQTGQNQSLTMTPQLQQAIKLLQMPNAELSAYIDAEIEKNPLLERIVPDETILAGHASAQSTDMPVPVMPSYGTPLSGRGATHSSSGGSGGSGRGFDLESVVSAGCDLRQHLQAQIDLVGFSPPDRVIASRLIDEICESGFMRTDPADISVALGVDVDRVLEILHICQGFEPTGIMARTLGECLQFQLMERNRFDPAIAILLDNLDLLARNDIAALAALCSVDTDDVIEMIAEVRALDPRPGTSFSDTMAPPITVIPDILVRRSSDGFYVVELNPQTLPRVLIDRSYYTTVSAKLRSPDEKNFLGECHANASWLVRSLDQRARTILKVSREIVRLQDGFFTSGVEAMIPLTLKTVAEASQMHESTVSRVTNNKYMATERGVFELKYFFSPAIPALKGGAAYSAEAVRYRIKRLVEAETSRIILSDDQIVERLRTDGIDIARRTVAKYRESLKIPSSIERRKRRKACGGSIDF